MQKAPQPKSNQTSLANNATLSAILFILGSANLAQAADWAELTGVAPLKPLSDSKKNTSAEKQQAPYTMLPTPAANTARSTKTTPPPDYSKPSTREYDLSVSDFEKVTDTTQKPKQGLLSRVTAAPKKAIGVTCGVCVGVPVAIARDTKKYTGQMNSSMTDGLGVEKEKGDIIGRVWAGAMALPFGLGSGLVHGSVTGVQNAVEHGKTQPLSKESMSLGTRPKSVSNRTDYSAGDN